METFLCVKLCSESVSVSHDKAAISVITARFEYDKQTEQVPLHLAKAHCDALIGSTLYNADVWLHFIHFNNVRKEMHSSCFNFNFTFTNNFVSRVKTNSVKASRELFLFFLSSKASF